MISINKWFSKNAKYPLFLLGLGTIVIQLCFIAYIFWSQSKSQNKSIENLFTIANLALEQKNRPILESTFDVAIEDLGVKKIFLCHNHETVITVPLSKYNCKELPPSNLFTKVLKYKAFGRPDYQFFFYMPLISWSGSYFVLFAITLVFFILSLLVIFKVQRRFTDDILTPLENNLLEDKPINIVQLDRIRKKVHEVSASKEKEAAANAILEHKTKIAHNIRSLVQTLKSLQNSIQDKLSPTKKNLFTDVVEGIDDILTEFSTENSFPAPKFPSTEEAFFSNLKEKNNTRTKVVVSEIVKSLVNQKRFELKSQDPNLSLSYKCNTGLSYSFIHVDENEFKAALSNIINNAFEAIKDDPKKMKVTLDQQGNFVEVSIKDNGVGISEKIKDSLFDRGVTFGKKSGTGYGLFHAKAFIESWGGTIQIESSTEKGTIFKINLPIWQPPKMQINDGDTIVILDDDPFIHDRWRSSLASFKEATGKQIDEKYFYDPEATQSWLSSENIDYSRIHFLVDNDLGEAFETGSNLIANLGISDVSTLVTNRYDDKKLNDFCIQNGIELLPKPYIFGSKSIISL